MEKHDVIVIGAGVAGLNAAYEIASKGYSVAVVESKPRGKIGDKTCGDAMGVHHFNRIGWKPPEKVIDHRYDGVKIYSPSEKYSITVPGEGLSLDRIGFGQWMLKRALDHGVELYDEHVLTDLVLGDNMVEKIRIRRKGSVSPIELSGKVFIDASGAKPALRSKLPNNWPISDKPFMSDYNIAYREVVLLDKPLVEDIEYTIIYLNTEIAPGGYWWLFPKKNDGSIVNVGLGVVWGIGQYNPRHNYEKYLKNRFRGEIIHRGGGMVPTRRPLPTLVWRNVVVVGDAAYTVNPVHGGGIGSSLTASHIASQYIVKALENGVVDENSMWGMNRDYMEVYGGKQAGLDIIRMFLQKLGNDDFEWIIKNKIITGEEIYELGSHANLVDEVVSNIMRFTKLLRKPSLLNKLRIVKKYMDQAIELYTIKYPEKPVDIFKWMDEVDRLFNEYRNTIGYDPGERVKW